MSGSDRPQFNEVKTANGCHLTDEELNQYLDGDLGPSDMNRATAHLVTCESCRTRLTDLRVVARIVSQLPFVPAPRSFQLGHEHLRSRRSLIDRVGAALMPALPTLRAATVAIALMLGGLTAFRVVDDQPQTGPVAEQTVRESTSAASTNQIAPALTIQISTATATMTTVSIAQKAPPSDESAAGAAAPAEQADDTQADEAAGSSLATTDDQAANSGADTSAADAARTGEEADATDANSVMVAMEMASPAPTASPSPSPSPAQTATASVVATPTVAITQQQEDANSWIGDAQWVLGVLLLGAVALTAALTVARRKLPDR